MRLSKQIFGAKLQVDMLTEALRDHHIQLVASLLILVWSSHFTDTGNAGSKSVEKDGHTRGADEIMWSKSPSAVI
ncbi:MAG: hypothetical protein ACOH5I_01220 [Oligoflexus sp.]